MRVLSRFALAVVLVTGVAVVSGPMWAPAHATTLAPLTVEQLTDASDLIVRGTVLEVHADLDENGYVFTYATVRVTESVKGYAAVGDVLTVESPGGVYEGGVANTELAARYSVEEDVVLFVTEKRHGTAFGTVGLYLGKYTVKQDPSTGRPMVLQFTVPYTRSYDARFLPNPPVAERVTLEALRGQVHARLALGWDGKPIPGVSADKLRSINKLQPGVR
jgi:hypothetical protein